MKNLELVNMITGIVGAISSLIGIMVGIIGAKSLAKANELKAKSINNSTINQVET